MFRQATNINNIIFTHIINLNVNIPVTTKHSPSIFSITILDIIWEGTASQILYIWLCLDFMECRCVWDKKNPYSFPFSIMK